MSSENPSDVITECKEESIPTNDQHIGGEQHQEHDKPQHGNFSRAFGNMLRRSKRLMSGKRRSNAANTIPENQPIKTEVNGEPGHVKDETPDMNETKDSVDGTISSAREQDSFEEPGSPRGRKQSHTYYGSEKQVLRDGKKIKEIEVTGEAPDEIDMKKQKKLQRRKSIDKEVLNVACRALGKADHEGWLYKKAGGHGIVPISWKKFWVVVKSGKLYCYKTSFNISADYLLIVNDYTVEETTEKKKACVFQLKPKEEDKKIAVFACDSEEELKDWKEILNKVLEGVDLSKDEDSLVPDYEHHKRLNTKTKDDMAARKHHRPISTAFPTADVEETTGLPAGFGARTQSLSQPRVRKMSSEAKKPSSVLSVGSMFHPLETAQDKDTSATGNGAVLKDILYREVVVESEEQQPTVNGDTTPAVEDKKESLDDAEAILNEIEEQSKQHIKQTPEVVVPVEPTPAPTAEPETPAQVAEQEAPAPAAEPEAPVPAAEPEASVPVAEPEAPVSAAEPEAPAPAAEPETLAPAAEPEAPAPATEPETLAPAAELEAPAPVVEQEALSPVAEPEAPASVAEPEAPAPIAEPEAPAPIVEQEAPAPVAELEAPAPVAEPEAPIPTAELEAPAPVAEPETPAQVAKPESPVPAVEPEAPASAADPETPIPADEPEAPAPAAEPESPAQATEPETPAPVAEPEAPAPAVEPETPAPAVEPETPALAAELEAPAPVEPVAPAPAAEPEVLALAEPEAPATAAEPEAPAAAEPQAPAPAAEPETPALAAEPEASASTAEPETPAQAAEPEASAPAAEPEAPVPAAEPEAPVPVAETETPAPAAKPEAPAPAAEPETPAQAEPEAPVPKSESEALAPAAETVTQNQDTLKTEDKVSNIEQTENKTNSSQDVDDDLDIPNIDSGNSSLMDDITMELASKTITESSDTQPNGSAVASQ